MPVRHRAEVVRISSKGLESCPEVTPCFWNSMILCVTYVLVLEQRLLPRPTSFVGRSHSWPYHFSAIATDYEVPSAALQRP
jgi:hypothetical protein